jgi:hypothetical protein
MLQLIIIGSFLAILFSFLNEVDASAGFTAITMGGAFIAAIIYGLLTEA